MSKKPKTIIGATDVHTSSGPDRVFVLIGRTVALPGYESIRVEYGEGAGVRKGQDRDEVAAELTGRVVANLKEILELAKETVR